MKKPNITEGEWGIDESNPLTDEVRYVSCNGVEIATLYGVGSDYKPNAINDLKAISAVPEMINALMAVMEYNEIPCQENYDNMIKAAKQALKKQVVYESERN